MRIASIQLALNDTRTKTETIAYALSMMDKCKGADLIMLPEIWNIGFMAYDKYWSESEPVDGATASAVARKAKELNSYVLSGSFVESRNGKYYNTCVMFDRMGKAIGQYSKIHLFTYQSKESELLNSGTDISVVETEFGKMGLSTCYDLRFPELYRAMVDAGAEFFLVTSCWLYPRHDAWNILNRARALENTCFLISCDAAGYQHGSMFLGHSQIVDPWGTVVAGSSFYEDIVMADIDPGLVKRVRDSFPVLKDRVLVGR